MKFHQVSLAQSEGHILGHNVLSDTGRRLMRKGRKISAEDIATLAKAGRTAVFIAELAPDDVHEDLAAAALAQVVAGSHLILSRATAGRVNIYAEQLSVVSVDPERLLMLNLLDGIALATVTSHSVAQPGEMVANLKIIPYSLPKQIVDAGVTIVKEAPLITSVLLSPKKVGLIVIGTTAAKEKSVNSFVKALSPRLERLNAMLQPPRFVALEHEMAEVAIHQAVVAENESGLDLLLLAGETAIMDIDDVIPAAVRSAGCEVVGFGLPVDPGNLLMLGYLAAMPVVGVPGCARNPKANVIDLILPRLLSGEQLSRRDLMALGHGGLL